MPRLLSDYWYRHHAVLVAASAAEAFAAASGRPFDMQWSSLLFSRLLGLPRAERVDAAVSRVDPLSLPVPVRRQVFELATATGPQLWGPAARIFSPQVHRTGRLRVAKLFAELLHNGIAPPATLWQIAQHELPDLQACGEVGPIVAAIDGLAKELRGSADQLHKLRAITAFGEDVPQVSSHWPALEIALVQPLIDWIPVVVGAAEQHADNPGVMMPIIVRLSRGTGLPSDGGMRIDGMIGQIDELERSAERARRAAIELWRNRYGRGRPTLRAQVDGATAVVDLQLSTGLGAALTTLRMNARAAIEVDGDSLELPLALAFYRDLTGLRRTGDVRATGKLGRFDPDPQDSFAGGDTFIDQVLGRKGKALAAEAQLADRFILPPGEAARRGNAFAYCAHSLGAAVDLTFSGGHRFVRTADVAALSKSPTYLASEKQRVRDQLRNCASPVIELDESPGLVAASLMAINAAVSKGGPHSKGRYVFVRLSPTEKADAAWATIWSSIDGDPADLDRFIWAGGDDERAAIFARQLARCRPKLGSPMTSPHVLVIIGAGESEQPQGLLGGPHASFALRRVLQRLPDFLGDDHSPADPRLRVRLGPVRVVLLRDEGLPSSDLALPAEVDPALREAVVKLSAFRYGFTFAMACRQLGEGEGTDMSTPLCFDLLAAMRALKLSDGLPLLVAATTNAYRQRAAPAAFEMMLRARQMPPEPEKRFVLHSRAAVAIAPLLRPGGGHAHIELATSLSAPWLDEGIAQLSIALAAGAIARIGSVPVRDLRAARVRLLRFSGSTLLERLPLLSGRHGDPAAYEDFAGRLRRRHHPALHVRAAAMAVALAGDPARPLREQLEIYRTAARHLEDSDVANTFLTEPTERVGATFLADTMRCRIAWETRRLPASASPIARGFAHLCAISIEHLPSMREIYWADWFERAGDLIADDAQARQVYRAGLWNAVLPSGSGVSDRLLVKWVGTFDVGEPVPASDCALIRAHADARFWPTVQDPAAVEQAEMPLATAHRWFHGLRRIFHIASPQVRRMRIATSLACEEA